MTNYVGDVIFDLASEFPYMNENLLDFYALLVLVKGKDTTLENVHDAWAVWTNATNSYHRSLIPFEELSAEVQELDRLYADVIVKVSKG